MNSVRYMAGLSFLLVALFFVHGCATPPHLDSNEVAALRAMRTAIFVVEPAKSLYIYSGVGPGFADFTNGPPDNIAAETFLYGIGGAVTSTIVYEKQLKKYDTFMTAFGKYQKVVKSLPITQDLLQSTHDSMMMVPWYRSAEWKVLKRGNEDDFEHITAQSTSAQEVIFIYPAVMFRIDAEMVRVAYGIKVYVKNPNNKYDLRRFDSWTFEVHEPVYPGNDIPTDEKEDAFDNLDLDTRLKDVFSDDGVLFHHTLSSILAISGREMASYFAGHSVTNNTAQSNSG